MPQLRAYLSACVLHAAAIGAVGSLSAVLRAGCVVVRNVICEAVRSGTIRPLLAANRAYLTVAGFIMLPLPVVSLV